MSTNSTPMGTPVRPSPTTRTMTSPATRTVTSPSARMMTHERRPSYSTSMSFTTSKKGPVIFAFGTGDRYMICNGTRWWWNDLPEQLHEAVGEQGRNVDAFIACAFGTDDQHFITFRQRGGKITQRRHQLPPKLNDWLYKNSRYTRNLETLRVTLGPNDSFFAMDKTGLRWDKLPEKLEAQLQDNLTLEGWKSPPRTVALGVESSFVLIDWKGNIFRDLQNKYDDLDRYLNTPNIGQDIEYISLDAIRGKYYFVKKKGGRRYWNPPALDKIMPDFVRQLSEGAAMVPPRSIESLITEKKDLEQQLAEREASNQNLQDLNKRLDQNLLSISKDSENRIKTLRKELSDKKKEWKDRNDALSKEIAVVRAATTSTAARAIALTNEKVSHDSMLRQQMQAAQQSNDAHNKAMVELNTQFIELMNSVSSNK